MTSCAFYWHEIESEVRERGVPYVFFGSNDECIDEFLSFVERKRTRETYPHCESTCSDMCKMRGKVSRHTGCICCFVLLCALHLNVLWVYM